VIPALSKQKLNFSLKQNRSLPILLALHEERFLNGF